MPVIDIKNGEFIEKTVKKTTSGSGTSATTTTTSDIESDKNDNVWLNLLTSKFNLILIAVILILGYLLYRAYKNE